MTNFTLICFAQTMFEENETFDVGGFVNGVLMRDACADSSSPYLLGMTLTGYREQTAQQGKDTDDRLLPLGDLFYVFSL